MTTQWGDRERIRGHPIFVHRDLRLNFLHTHGVALAVALDRQCICQMASKCQDTLANESIREWHP